MVKWALGLILLMLLGSGLAPLHGAWVETKASTRSYRTVSSTHEYPIAPSVTISSYAPNAGDIIYVAVVGGADSSDTIVTPTRNTVQFSAAHHEVESVAPDSWGSATATTQTITLNAVLKITAKAGATMASLNIFLSNLTLKTMAYRPDKTIVFLLDKFSTPPRWTCFNARTVSVNFNIQCSSTHGVFGSNDTDNDLPPQNLVSFSPNEFLAFKSLTSRAANTCPFSTYEKEWHSTHQTMATINSSGQTQMLTFTSPSTFELTSPATPGSCGSDREYTTAGHEALTSNTIFARMVIMRPNPFLHAQPF